MLFHTYVLEKYSKDKLTISYLSSVHFHKHYAICGNTGVLGQNGRGNVNRSRPTYYDIDMDLQYTMSRAYIDLLQWMLFNI